MGVELAIFGILSAGAQIAQARAQQKASEKQLKAQRGRQARNEVLLAEQQAAEERTRVRDIQRTGRRRRAGADPGLRSTVLTGPSGIQPSAPGTTGGKTLLGL